MEQESTALKLIQAIEGKDEHTWKTLLSAKLTEMTAVESASITAAHSQEDADEDN